MRKTFSLSNVVGKKIEEIAAAQNISQSKVIETAFLFYILMQNDESFPFETKESFFKWKEGVEKDWHLIQLVLLGGSTVLNKKPVE